VHGNVEFRIHRVGRRGDGAQKYRARCPACHADQELARRRGEQQAPARTLVATDGSHTRRESGYAYVVDAHTYGYGPLSVGVDTELVAVRRALREVPGPLLITLDHTPTYTYVALGQDPKPHNPYRDAYLSTRAMLAGRDVAFVLRDRDTGPPEHALAHYLAFLGRIGLVPAAGQTAPGADQVLRAEQPYEVAADLVRAHLFPNAPRTR
jgi:hypothetical protein